jgi:hypothetical protein
LVIIENSILLHFTKILNLDRFLWKIADICKIWILSKNYHFFVTFFFVKVFCKNKMKVCLPNWKASLFAATQFHFEFTVTDIYPNIIKLKTRNFVFRISMLQCTITWKYIIILLSIVSQPVCRQFFSPYFSYSFLGKKALFVHFSYNNAANFFCTLVCRDLKKVENHCFFKVSFEYGRTCFIS